MPTKARHCLSAKDIAVICDVYKDIQFDFDQGEIFTKFLSGMFGGGGKHLRSVTVDGEMKWGLIDEGRLSKVVDDLMSKHAISTKWSARNLLNQIEEMLLEHKASGVEDIKPEINALVKDIFEKSFIEYEICMPIYGASIAKDSCIKIGKYSFMHIDYLTKKKYNRIMGADSIGSQSKAWRAECFVCTNVCTCEKEKAVELALTQFKWIENAIRMFLHSNKFNVGITNYNDRWIERCVVAIKGRGDAGLSSSLKGPIFPVRLEGIVFAKEFRRMISLLGVPGSQLTEMQKRIKHAIYLCGLSTQAIDSSVGYFLCVAALEALFYRQDNPYVSASSSQQIIESFCYLIIDKDKRREYFDGMQDFYSKRSAFAHGGEKELSEEDVLHVRQYVFAAISKLLTDENLCKIATMSDLQSLIKDIKFGKKKQKGLAT